MITVAYPQNIVEGQDFSRVKTRIEKKCIDPPFANNWLAYLHSRGSNELNLKVHGPCRKEMKTFISKVY